ncbi:hypothetical protein DESC_680018 [Desulfosarcina cetonica]|nr:hypothetical protein DESC_680018 [Desulfosarcina cetonica]
MRWAIRPAAYFGEHKENLRQHVSKNKQEMIPAMAGF